MGVRTEVKGERVEQLQRHDSYSMGLRESGSQAVCLGMNEMAGEIQTIRGQNHPHFSVVASSPHPALTTPRETYASY